MNFSKMVGTFPAVLNFDRLFLKLNRLSVTNCRFSPIIDQGFGKTNGHFQGISWNILQINEARLKAVDM